MMATGRNMLRYLEQDTFDALVIYFLMTRPLPTGKSDDRFASVLKEYLRMYPSEDAKSLVSDIISAARMVEQETFANFDHALLPHASPRVPEARFAILQQLFHQIQRDHKRQRPFWRRI